MVSTRDGWAFLAVLLLFFASVGCSQNVGLRGKVTFSDDGSPVPVGTIAFLKDGLIARGDIKPDGSYVVGFERETNGLPPGDYQVFVTADDIVGKTQSDFNIIRSLIDRKYNNPDTSGMTLQVTSQTKTFDIVLDRNTKER